MNRIGIVGGGFVGNAMFLLLVKLYYLAGV